MEKHAKTSVVLGQLKCQFARLASVTAMKILSAILTLGILGWASTAHAAIPASQRTVLTDLFTSTNGAAWINKTNWNGAVGTECTWFGVTCDAAQSNVVSIQLRSNNLVGTLPALSGLSALQTFDVFGNFLTGPIPSLTGLTALQFFLVQHNQLTGAMPSLTGLTALQHFAVDFNQLTGSIPSLNTLTALRGFSAFNNQLTGAIPPLSGLTALQFIDVTGNFGGGGNLLTGTIPSLTGLTNLSNFRVSNNQLTGTIPSLTGLTALQIFRVNNNQLTGAIPSITGLTALQSLDVNSNQLTGPVPAPPASLLAGQSNLCANTLTSSGVAAIDTAWNTATGVNWLACQTASPAPVCELIISHQPSPQAAAPL